jgi:putative oligomerization/nucleic acid binding protein
MSINSKNSSVLEPERITMNRSKVLIVYALLVVMGCATSSPIQRYSESQSHFTNPPELVSNDYPAKDVYRIYHRASTGFTSIQSIRKAAMRRADDFAQRQGKTAFVLGERISEPPYIFGNFPKIEIVFALIDKPTEKTAATSEEDKYADLEKLKKLLDEGVLTTNEFETEKAKILK